MALACEFEAWANGIIKRREKLLPLAQRFRAKMNGLENCFGLEIQGTRSVLNRGKEYSQNPRGGIYTISIACPSDHNRFEIWVRFNGTRMRCDEIHHPSGNPVKLDTEEEVIAVVERIRRSSVEPLIHKKF